MSSDKKSMFAKLRTKDQMPILLEDIEKVDKKLDEFIKESKKYSETTDKRLKNIEDYIENRVIKLEGVMKIILSELENAGKLPDKIAHLQSEEGEEEYEPEQTEEQIEAQKQYIQS